MSKDNQDLPDFDFDAIFNPEDYCRFWDEFTSDEQTEIQIGFLDRELDLGSPCRILDLPCGFGRHSVRLAAAGHAVVGIDNNPGFLAKARRDAEEVGVEVDFRQDDMRNIDFDGEFDRVITLFTSVGFFSDEENFKVLQNVARALWPNGLFCLDTLNRDAIAQFFKPFNVTERGEDMAVDRCSFDPVNGWIINKRVVFRKGKKRETPFFVRIYNASEIRTLLHQAGFKEIRFFGDWQSGPLTYSSIRLIAIGKK